MGQSLYCSNILPHDLNFIHIFISQTNFFTYGDEGVRCRCQATITKDEKFVLFHVKHYVTIYNVES